MNEIKAGEVKALTTNQVRALVTSGRWAGNALSAHRWYVRGDESDQLVARRIMDVFGETIQMAYATSKACRAARVR